jgi:diguanylate cyclase (GGDEF)-like protein
MPIHTGPMRVLEDCSGQDRDALLLAAIAASAEDLTNGRGWPDGVHGLLETLGRITGVSRVWIFQDYTFEWAREPRFVQLGMPSFSMFRMPIDNEDYRQLIESRKRGEWQRVLTSELDPSPLKDSQLRQSILSMLTIPIMVEDEWWGVLGFDDCERSYDWSEREIALLRTATFLISNAVIRDRLGAVRKQFDILQSITENSAWELNLKTGNFWCTPELINKLPGTTRNLRLGLRGALRLVHHEDRAGLVRAVRAFLEGGEGGEGGSFRHDLRVYADCGEIRWVEIIGSVGRDGDGQPEQLAGIAVDILKRKEREERLLQEASTDYLTGAANRAMFEARLRASLVASLEHASPLSLLVLDIDHFKAVNDTWGHDAGDGVLREFVALCSSMLRGSDVLARIGGEEFAILLPDTPRDQAAAIGERIRAGTQTHAFPGPEGDIRVTVSIGLDGCDGMVPVTPEALLKSADSATYTAKHKGRNRLESTDRAGGCCLYS